jgi:hypothetical protein
MAIEYQIKGPFALTSSLKATLLRTMGEDAGEVDPHNPAVVFALEGRLVSVAGVPLPDDGATEAMLFFRIDKNALLEGILQVVDCLGAVLRTTPEDLRFYFQSERMFLRRTRGGVTLFTFADDPENEFWNESRRSRLGVQATIEKKEQKMQQKRH